MKSAPIYTVFSRRHQSALCCAIDQESPVPSFIQAKTWEYGGTIKPMETVPSGFQLKAAQEAMTLVGYYLFYSVS